MPGSSDSGSAPLTMTRSAGGSRRAQPPTSRTATSRGKISQLEGSLHEPAGTARGFGVRQTSGAFGSGPRAQTRQRTAAAQDASGPAAVFFFNSSSSFRPPSSAWWARMTDKSSDSPRNAPAEYLVILVKAVPEPAPNRASVAPPPKATPAPASFLGS